MPAEIVTERLLLRTWEPEDAASLAEIYRQREYLATMPPANAEEQIAASIDAWLLYLADKRLYSFTAPDSRRSRAVRERLGMTYGGTALWKGFEHVRYALDRKEVA